MRLNVCFLPTKNNGRHERRVSSVDVLDIKKIEFNKAQRVQACKKVEIFITRHRTQMDLRRITPYFFEFWHG
jgi:hypothetical protein